LTLACGDRDRFVPEPRLQQELSRLGEAALPVTLRRFAGGHRFDDATVAAVVAADGLAAAAPTARGIA
jgi:hypothetical protein